MRPPPEEDWQDWIGRVRGQTREPVSPHAVKTALDQLVAAYEHARPIALRPFNRTEVAGMLTALGPSHPPARLVDRFADHTGGNPFFVAELFVT